MDEQAEFEQWLVGIDDELMKQINQLPDLKAWYDFFNSESNPLNPREFLHYWSSLSVEEQWAYMIYTPKEILERR